MKHYVLNSTDNTNFRSIEISMSCSEQLLSNLLKERHLFTVQSLILVNNGEENGRVCYR